MANAAPAISTGSAQDESATSATAKRAANGIASALLAVAMGHFAVDVCTGIWPVYKTLAALDLSRAGFVATLGSVIGNGLQPLFGVLADRGWRRLSLLIGLVLSGAVVFVPYFTSYSALFLLVLLTAVGSAAFHPAGAGAATSISSKHTGVLLAVFLIGGYVGYALSQLLFTATYHALHGATGLLCLLPLLACIGIALRVRETVRPTRSASNWRADLHQKLSPLATLFTVQFLSSAINVATVFLMPDLLLSRGSPTWLVQGGGHAALVMGGALSLFPAGHAADRLGGRNVLLAANLLSGFFLLGLLIGPSTPWFEIAMALGLGAFNGANSVVAVSEGNRLFPGKASAVSALLMGLPWCFSSLAPWLAGVLANPARGGSPTHALGWMSLAIPAALLCSVGVPSRTPTSPATA